MLTIDDVHAEYLIPAGTPDPAALRTRLDRVAKGRLPDQLAASLAAFDEGDAVVRIRQLTLDLWLDALAMSDADMARAWSGLIARGLARALTLGSPADMVRYDDHAHFVAAFLTDLLGGMAWSRWMYAEFAPLRDLPPGAAAAHILAARPALLIPVARRLARGHRLEALVAQMRLADVRLILRNGLGFEAPPTVSVDAAVVLDLLAGNVALEHGAGAAAQARNTLRSYLTVMVRASQPLPPAQVLVVSYHLALLHALWSARPAPALWAALAAREIDEPSALQPLLASLAQELDAARTWLVQTLASAQGRDYLAQLLPVAAPGIEARQMASRLRQEPDGSRRLRTASAFAGLALLLPTIRDLDLYDEVGRPGVYQLLLAAAGRRLQPLAAGDLGIAWLSGLLPEEIAKARAAAVSWPDMSRWHDPAEIARGVDTASEHLGNGSAASFAWLTFRHFSRSLPRLSESSPGYLAAQFLNAAGELRWSDEALEVVISQAPLRVVLHMAGYSGEQGPVPWLDGRQLIIHLPE